jgi:hypothetical protein
VIRREVAQYVVAAVCFAFALGVGCVHSPDRDIRPLRGPIGGPFPSTTFPSGDGDAVEVTP